jgi:tetratricopeptide (TPR) repeat protein
VGDLPPKPLCFVLMPFGRKPDGTGRIIDFDAVYSGLIAPAVLAAGMEVIRADQEEVGGTIHKPMFERLMLCDYAVADVTGANPNVYYELGVRHALRPRSTVILFAQGTALPFDIVSLRGLPYAVSATGLPEQAQDDCKRVTTALRTAHDDYHDDSPVYQFIDDMPRPKVERERADVFRKQVEYSREFKARLAKARTSGIEAVKAIAVELNDLSGVESGIVMDLFLSFRHFGTKEGFLEMLKLYDCMPRPLKQARMTREQYALALNRLARHDEAEDLLAALIKEFGQNSETNGLLGRIYKDKWAEAKAASKEFEASGYLDRAIKTYREGFDADWRDPYPGINTVTLMEMLDDPASDQADLLPVVRYAALRRAQTNGDYWDYATVLELAVLARNKQEARRAAADAMARATEAFAPQSTARNLRLIREKRQGRNEDVSWIAAIEDALMEKHRALQGGG